MMKQLAVVVMVCAIGFFAMGAADEAKKPPQTPNGIAWVALQVDDLSESAKFFREKLNFKGQREGEFYLFQVTDGQYFVLVEKKVEDSKTDGAIISFNVKNVDDYFKQVSEKGVEPIDHLNEGKKLERPVWRDWGSKEFGVKAPDGTVIVFTKMSY